MTFTKKQIDAYRLEAENNGKFATLEPHTLTGDRRNTLYKEEAQILESMANSMMRINGIEQELDSLED